MKKTVITPLLFNVVIGAAFVLDPAAAAPKIDEPGGSVTLPVNAALDCPGFYVVNIADGPDPGVGPGSFGVEVTLSTPGSLLLQGGLNFGGLVAEDVPGFAAFNIANAASEPQNVSLEVAGFDASSGGSVDLLVRLLRREGSMSETVLEATVTVSGDSTQVLNTTVDPGFYVAEVQALGDVRLGADAFFTMAALTSFTDRAGGGFQGGVIVGGYHDPAVVSTTGFAGFCLADEHVATVRTEGAPTRGPGGATDLAVSVTDSGSLTVFADPDLDDHGDSCEAATAISGDFSGTMNSTFDTDYFQFDIASTGSVTFRSASDLDLRAALLDDGCRTLATDDDGAGDGQFELTRELSPGRYFLSIDEFNGATGNYAVTYSLN